MIKSFSDGETERVFERRFSAHLPNDIQSAALRELRMLGNAHGLDDLRSPPANRLEKLQQMGTRPAFLGRCGGCSRRARRARDLHLAEGVGFEPTKRLATLNGFQDRRDRPLCHPSARGQVYQRAEPAGSQDVPGERSLCGC